MLGRVLAEVTVAMLKALNLGVRFALELAVLAALALWGFRLPAPLAARVAVGLGAPLAMALLWANLGAPKAPYALSGASRVALHVVVFGLGALALGAGAGPVWGWAFGVLFVLNEALLLAWRQ